MSATDPSSPYLLFRVGPRAGAFALRQVSETMRPLPIEPIAGAPSFVLGVTLLRGVLTPVVDGRRLLGTSASTPAARLVAVSVAGRQVALAVDDVLGVRRLREGTIAGLPPLLRHVEPDAAAALGTLDDELLVVLDGARLVPEPMWWSLAAGGDAEPLAAGGGAA